MTAEEKELTLEKLRGEEKDPKEVMAEAKRDNFKISLVLTLLYGLMFFILSIGAIFEMPIFKTNPISTLVGGYIGGVFYSSLLFGAPTFVMSNWKSASKIENQDDEDDKDDSSKEEEDSQEIEYDQAA